MSTTQPTPKNILKGNHGFNNSIDSMKAIFIGDTNFNICSLNYSNTNYQIARGPNFLKNQKINGFNNVDVYPLLCNILQITCNPNNGTIESFANVLVNVPQISTQTPSDTNISIRTSARFLQLILVSIVFLFMGF